MLKALLVEIDLCLLKKNNKLSFYFSCEAQRGTVWQRDFFFSKFKKKENLKKKENCIIEIK
jgi:hypothetical protein